MNAELDKIDKCVNCKTFNCGECDYASDALDEEPEESSTLYRPRSLNEYIGQQRAKDLISLNLKKIAILKPVHFLISGPRGTGKTTLAYIVKNELKTVMLEKVAGEITNQDRVQALVRQINGCSGTPVVFLDEIHALKPQLAELLYPLMEDFKSAGKRVKPFILIGATTEKNVLIKKVAPLVDRFQVQVDLENYNATDIVTILKQYKQRMFDDRDIAATTYSIIAHNCKYTPRIGITLLEDSVVEPDIKKVMEYHRIIGDGLNDVDKRILEVLKEHDKPIGGASLARIVGISEQDYIQVYENYLVAYEYIIPTNRGRVISEKGLRFLANVEGR